MYFALSSGLLLAAIWSAASSQAHSPVCELTSTTIAISSTTSPAALARSTVWVTLTDYTTVYIPKTRSRRTRYRTRFPTLVPPRNTTQNKITAPFSRPKSVEIGTAVSASTTCPNSMRHPAPTNDGSSNASRPPTVSTVQRTSSISQPSGTTRPSVFRLNPITNDPSSPSPSAISSFLSSSPPSATSIDVNKAYSINTMLAVFSYPSARQVQTVDPITTAELPHQKQNTDPGVQTAFMDDGIHYALTTTTLVHEGATESREGVWKQKTKPANGGMWADMQN